MDKTLLAWVQRALENDARSAGLLVEIARAATALSQGDAAKAEDILNAAMIGSMRADMSAIIDIAAERGRQVEAKGFTPEHDDQTADVGALALAAAAYAVNAAGGIKPSADREIEGRHLWPLKTRFKPESKDRRRQLVVAGALILAAVEAYDRDALRAHDTRS